MDKINEIESIIQDTLDNLQVHNERTRILTKNLNDPIFSGANYKWIVSEISKSNNEIKGSHIDLHLLMRKLIELHCNYQKIINKGE